MTAPEATRLVAVVGPTAAGKTELAIEIAEASDGEIVSVDSRQIYRHLDIGTAKPDPAQRARVPHHLIDVVDPDQHLDAARFAGLARAAIADIRARGRSVVLCGGSGLYLRALLEGLAPLPAADPEIRARLHARLEADGAPVLHDELARVDPVAAARIAPRDAIRVIRALEVFTLTGRPISERQREAPAPSGSFAALIVRVWPPVADLEARIARRTRQMWDAGLVEETQRTLALGFAADLAPLQAIGYREAQSYSRGEIAEADAVAAITLATRQYAKRQRTWFRRVETAVAIDGAERRGEAIRRAREHLLATQLS